MLGRRRPRKWKTALRNRKQATPQGGSVLGLYRCVLNMSLAKYAVKVI